MRKQGPGASDLQRPFDGRLLIPVHPRTCIPQVRVWIAAASQTSTMPPIEGGSPSL
jgi:hypothetical protein